MGKTIMEFFLTDVDYSTDKSGEPFLRLFGTTDQGKKVVAFDHDFRPYFWVLAEEGKTEELAKKIEKIKEKGSVRVNKVLKTSIEEKKFLGERIEAIKVVINHPRAEDEVRDQIKELEGFKRVKERGMSYYRRYLVDKDIYPFTKVKVKGEPIEKKGYRTDYKIKIESIEGKGDLYKDLKYLVFDLEVYNYRINPRPEKDPILMISVDSNMGVDRVMTWKKIDKENADVYGSEMEMIQAFLTLIKRKQPDIIIGYNSDDFDFEYLRKRARKYNLKLDLGLDGSKMKFVRRGRTYRARVKGITHVDLLPFIKRVMGPTLDTQVYDLNSVAEELLGREKKELDWESIWEMWDKEGEALERLFEYSINDANLTKALFEETKALQLELTKLIGLPLFDIIRMGFSQYVEWYLIRKAKEKNELIPNRPDRKEIRKRRSESFTGGYVYQPEPGLYEDIVIVDYRSLYPSIIYSRNISPSSLDRGEENYESPEIEGKTYKFDKKEKGFIPSVLKGLIDRRARIKNILRNTEKGTTEYKILKARSQSLKTLANSVHPKTNIVLKDPQGDVKLMKIEEFFEEIENKGEEEVRNSKIKEVNKWKALSVENNEAVFKSIYSVIKHKCEDRLMKIRTKMGQVEITKAHSIIGMEGRAAHRIRNSEFKGINPIQGDKVNKDTVIAQVNDIELGGSRKSLNLFEFFNSLDKSQTENLRLYLPKSLNLDKNNWYKNRVELLDYLDEKKEASSEIQRKIGVSRRFLRRVENEKMVEPVGEINFNNDTIKTPIYRVSKRGKTYRKFYELFKTSSKTSQDYVVPIEDYQLPEKFIKKGKIATGGWAGAGRGKIPNLIPVNEDLAGLFGWYVGEGHSERTKNQTGGYSYEVSFTNTDPRNKKEIGNLIKKVFGIKPYIGKKTLSVNLKTLYLLFKETAGSYSKNKKIPHFILNSPKNVRDAFLRAYLKGDGDKDGRRASTNSRELKDQLSLLFKEDDCILHNGKDSGVYRISKRTKTRGKKIVSGDLYGQTPKKITKGSKPDYVYDISVEDTENFVTAEGIVLHNSSYGYYGFAPARWYCKECARSATAWGRKYIKDTIEWSRDAGFGVIYSDTDSCFLTLKEGQSQKNVFKFIQKVNKKLPGGMKLEFEGLYPRGIFVSKKKKETGAKKKYALMDKDGNLIIKGFEYVRRDWADIAKETQKKVLKAILEGSKEEAVSIIRKVIKKIQNQKIEPERLAIYTKLKKKIEDYESIGPHVMAAKKAKEAGYHIEKGTIIRYLVTKKGGDRISDRSRILRQVKEEDLKYDPKYYIEHQLMPAVMRIMDVIGYSKVDVVGKGQTRLGRFES